jgi:transcriptional antiterminator NusG
MQNLGIHQEEIQVGYDVGDTVVVIGGAWKDTTGVVASINKQKQTVTINVELFGRETPVEIDFADVRLAD